MTIDLTPICEAVARELYGDMRSAELAIAGMRMVRPYVDAAAPLIERAARADERANMAAIRAEDRALIVRFMREIRPRETRTGRYATGYRAAIDLMIARTEATVDA